MFLQTSVLFVQSFGDNKSAYSGIAESAADAAEAQQALPVVVPEARQAWICTARSWQKLPEAA